MTHKLKIVEAATGKVVKEESFDLDRRTEKCASSVKGSSYQGADYIPKVISALLPLQPAGVPLPKADRFDLDAVCSGGAVPQAAPYEAGDKKRAVHVLYFPTAEQSFSREDAPEGLALAGTPEEDVTKYELVACATGKPINKKASCDFTGGKVLEVYDGDVEVAVREAKTGKLVETKTFKGTSSGCPYSHKFFGNPDKRILKVEPGLQVYLGSLTGTPVAPPKPQGRQGGGRLDERLH